MNTKASGLFDALSCPEVVEGTCVVVQEGKLLYAGPVQFSPEVAGSTVLLSSADYATFTQYINQRRH